MKLGDISYMNPWWEGEEDYHVRRWRGTRSRFFFSRSMGGWMFPEPSFNFPYLSMSAFSIPLNLSYLQNSPKDEVSWI